MRHYIRIGRPSIMLYFIRNGRSGGGSRFGMSACVLAGL
jgi:hypothetical protein